VPTLPHDSETCTGEWRLGGNAKHRRLYCNGCGVRVEPTQENRLAAIDENYAGIYLRRLTTEGVTLLTPETGT
jgi:hypothetical protein